MNIHRDEKIKALEVLVEDICGQRHQLEKLIQQFRHRIAEIGSPDSSWPIQTVCVYWKHVAFVDSLVRLRLFIEQNFHYVETVGVLAVARYLLELNVWLKLLQIDVRYGLVYYCELLKKQLEFYKEFRNNAVREIYFLRHTGSLEQSLIKTRVTETMQIPDEEARSAAFRELNDEVTLKIDEEASRKFSLYAEQAQTNGYDFQAHLVETKVLPEYSKAIADLEQELAAFERDTPSEIKSLAPKRWNWKDQAQQVGLKDEVGYLRG